MSSFSQGSSGVFAALSAEICDQYICGRIVGRNLPLYAVQWHAATWARRDERTGTHSGSSAESSAELRLLELATRCVACALQVLCDRPLEGCKLWRHSTLQAGSFRDERGVSMSQDG